MDARPRVAPLPLGLVAFALVAQAAVGQTTTTTIIRRATLAPASMPDGVATEVVKPGELPANVFAEDKPAAGASPEASKQAARLQKIQQLGFDRRPSAILKAWSDPAGKDAPKPPPPAPGAPAPPPPDPFDAELASFRRQVTLGDWPGVAKFLAALPEAEGKAAYKRLVAALPNPVADAAVAGRPGMPQPAQQNNGQFPEKVALLARDVLAVAEVAPHGRDKEALAGLGQLLRLALAQGDSVEDFIALVRQARGDAARAKAALNDREAAKLLLASGNPVEAKTFLPDPEKAEADNDREALNLLSVHYLAIYAKEKKVVHLERAWKVTLAVLAVGEVDAEQKEEALKRAVELAPKIREDLGRRWLEESFTKRPERGMEIIATIGGAASRGLQAQPVRRRGAATLAGVAGDRRRGPARLRVGAQPRLDPEPRPPRRRLAGGGRVLAAV